ncbi:hypothetical protein CAUPRSCDRAFT_11908, partial [Caulochytrium protostelioides]
MGQACLSGVGPRAALRGRGRPLCTRGPGNVSWSASVSPSPHDPKLISILTWPIIYLQWFALIPHLTSSGCPRQPAIESSPTIVVLHLHAWDYLRQALTCGHDTSKFLPVSEAAAMRSLMTQKGNKKRRRAAEVAAMNPHDATSARPRMKPAAAPLSGGTSRSSAGPKAAAAETEGAMTPALKRAIQRAAALTKAQPRQIALQTTGPWPQAKGGPLVARPAGPGNVDKHRVARRERFLHSKKRVRADAETSEEEDSDASVASDDGVSEISDLSNAGDEASDDAKADVGSEMDGERDSDAEADAEPDAPEGRDAEMETLLAGMSNTKRKRFLKYMDQQEKKENRHALMQSLAAASAAFNPAGQLRSSMNHTKLLTRRQRMSEAMRLARLGLPYDHLDVDLLVERDVVDTSILPGQSAVPTPSATAVSATSALSAATPVTATSLLAMDAVNAGSEEEQRPLHVSHFAPATLVEPPKVPTPGALMMATLKNLPTMTRRGKSAPLADAPPQPSTQAVIYNSDGSDIDESDAESSRPAGTSGSSAPFWKAPGPKLADNPSVPYAVARNATQAETIPTGAAANIPAPTKGYTKASSGKVTLDTASITASRAPSKLHTVPVARSPELQMTRLALPVVAEEDQILHAINVNDVLMVSGETGSGKTTQIPQFLYEAGYASRGAMIGITQPRRVAA